MRILIFPMGSAGDVHPFLGIGRALRGRGHDVRVVVNSYFEGAVRKSGLEFDSLGSIEEFKRVLDNPDLWNPQRAFRTLVREALEPTYAAIVEAARTHNQPGETLVVGSTLAIGARTAAEVIDAPYVSVHLAPSVFLSLHKVPRFDGMLWGPWVPRWLSRLQLWVGRKLTDRTVLPGLNRFRASLGLPPAREVIRDWWHSPRLSLGLFPDWFGPPQPDWPPQTRLTGFPLFDESGQIVPPPELEDFLASGPPPVVFTPGTAMAHGADFFRESVRACRRLGVRGILLTRFPETLPRELPASVRHFEYVPFSEVLPRAAALVSHGGIGTCAQALRAAIPHLVQHMAHDQADNAARLHELGVGDGIPARRYSAELVVEKLEALLSAPVRARCRALAAKFTPDDWIRRSCELIEAAALPPHAGKP